MSREFSSVFQGESLTPGRRLDIIHRFVTQSYQSEAGENSSAAWTSNEEQSRQYSTSTQLWVAGKNIDGVAGFSVEYHDKVHDARAKVYLDIDLEFREGEKSGPYGMIRASRADADAVLCMLEVETILQTLKIPDMRPR